MNKKSTLADDAKVKVMDRYCDEALHVVTQNLLRLDADRLLAGFCECAARIADFDEDALEDFMRYKKCYGGGWENRMIGGHTLGHYLTALAQAQINPGLSSKERGEVR